MQNVSPLQPSIDSSTIGRILSSTLARTGPATAARFAGVSALCDELLATAVSIASWVELVAAESERVIVVTDALGKAGRLLAPAGIPPADESERDALGAIVWSLDRLHGHGVHALGRLSFIGEDLLAALLEEAHRAQPPDNGDRRRVTGPAGDVLAALAVSRELRATVSTVLGASAQPTYDALYEFDAPGSFVGPHVDAREYPFVFHLLLDHWRGGAPASSTLTSFLPDRREPAKTALKAGEGLLLNGRGTLHCWAPLGDDERRTLVAIGYELEPLGQP